MPLKLKLNPETKQPIIEDDGRIIYVDSDGKELGLNPPAMYSKISDLGKENQKHRLKADELKQKLEQFNGIEDLTKWKEKADEALKTVENFNDKEWLKADKVDKLKADITSAYEEKIKQLSEIYSGKETELQTKIDEKSNQIRKLLISKYFAMSQYFSGGGDKSKTILPSNIAEDHFGKHFKIENGPDGLPVVRAFYQNGEPVLSRQNPGEPAEFEEAIGLIIDKYPGKESILRSGSQGSGSTGGTGTNTATNDIDQLKKNWAEAQKNGNIQEAITLKNRIYKLERAKKSA